MPKSSAKTPARISGISSKFTADPVPDVEQRKQGGTDVSRTTGVRLTSVSQAREMC